MTNLRTDIAETVERSPTATAIGFGGREISYGEFWE
jgi:hypothetical protein